MRRRTLSGLSSLVLGLLSVLFVLALTGCGSFRQRATEAEARIVDAEGTARIAKEAATANTGRILELEGRVDDLEAALDELRGTSSGGENAQE